MQVCRWRTVYKAWSLYNRSFTGHKDRAWRSYFQEADNHSGAGKEEVRNRPDSDAPGIYVRGVAFES
jgi:hypothetical protein